MPAWSDEVYLILSQYRVGCPNESLDQKFMFETIIVVLLCFFLARFYIRRGSGPEYACTYGDDVTALSAVPNYWSRIGDATHPSYTHLYAFNYQTRDSTYVDKFDE